MILSTFAILTSLSILVLGMALLSAPFILNEIYGVKPGDPDYTIYIQPDGSPTTPYGNILTNGYMTKAFYEGDKTITMDTKGLEELGMFYYDPNTC